MADKKGRKKLYYSIRAQRTEKAKEEDYFWSSNAAHNAPPVTSIAPLIHQREEGANSMATIGRPTLA